MKVTFKHMFHKPMTFQYPREQRTLPDTHRGALALLRYDDHQERCVGCDLCEAACPSRCIKVISLEDPARPLQRYASEFYIDITKCVFCGYCVEACPVNALAMTKMYEFSTHDKRTLLFDKKRLYEIGERHLDDAKKYLYAHNQEQNVEESREYRYYFPQSVLKPTQSPPKHLS
jgi:NADH-quinone oxidoreductase subunit I